VTAPQLSPSSADVTAVVTRLPQANAVFTPGPAGFTLPPFPFPTATLDFTAASRTPSPTLAIPAARSDPDAFLDGPLGAPVSPADLPNSTDADEFTDGPLGAPMRAQTTPDSNLEAPTDGPLGAPVDAPSATPPTHDPLADQQFGTPADGPLGAPTDSAAGTPADGLPGAPSRSFAGGHGDTSLSALADGWHSALADRSLEQSAAGSVDGSAPAGGSGPLPAAAPPPETAPSPSTAAAPSSAPGALGATLPGVPDGSEAEPVGATVSPAADGPAGRGADRPAGAAAPTPEAQAAPRRVDTGEWRGIVLVTGTDTDVGKTIVTAAVAAAAQASGLRVAVIKPGQTGIVTGAPTDLEVVNRLAAPETTRVLAEYPEPMAPLAAATVASLPPLELYEVVDAIRTEAEKHDLVLVEGAGGLLVPMGVRPSGASWTLADLATTLGVKTIVVARAGLGTLNHTALTLEALNRRGVPAGVVIGAWPADPELVHWANLSEMVPHLLGALPDGAGRMDPGVFRRSAPGWFTPPLYGEIDNWRVWAEETGEGHH
jgi:dethiobiotin synthetase